MARRRDCHTLYSIQVPEARQWPFVHKELVMYQALTWTLLSNQLYFRQAVQSHQLLSDAWSTPKHCALKMKGDSIGPYLSASLINQNKDWVGTGSCGMKPGLHLGLVDLASGHPYLRVHLRHQGADVDRNEERQ